MNKKYFDVPVGLKENNANITTGIAQNETGVIFNVTIRDGNGVYDFSGYTLVALSIIRPDGSAIVDGSNGANIDVLDATKGRIAINLPSGCTTQKGMHQCSLIIYCGTTSVATMRFNYMIGDSPYPAVSPASTELTIINQLIASVSGIATDEQARRNAEALRVTAENQRESATAGIVTRCQNLLTQVLEVVGVQKDLQTLYDAINQHTGTLAYIVTGSTPLSAGWLSYTAGGSAFTPVENKIYIIQTDGEYKNKEYIWDGTTYVRSEGLDLSWIAPKYYVDNHDAGGFTGQNISYIKIRRGTEANLPTLNAGEFGFCTDSGKLFIGNTGGNVRIGGPCYVAQPTAPTDTGKLWVDTSQAGGNTIKFHNGTAWTATNTAVFG